MTGCSTRTVWAAELGQGNLELFLRLAASLGMEVAGRALPSGEHLGERLLALRTRSGLSRLKVSVLSGASQTTVAQVEAGRAGHLAAFERIAGALGAGLMLVSVGQAASFFKTAAVSSACEAWSTPPELLEKLYQAIGSGFDVDPCAARRGRSHVRASLHFDEDDDGLAHEWHGTVFMNPPYGRDIGAWTEKACREVEQGRASMVVGLVPSRTDTRWWHSWVVGRADTWMLKGRLCFGAGDQAAPFASALVVWGSTAEFRRRISSMFPDAWHVARKEAEAPQQWLAAD